MQNNEDVQSMLMKFLRLRREQLENRFAALLTPREIFDTFGFPRGRRDAITSEAVNAREGVVSRIGRRVWWRIHD